MKELRLPSAGSTEIRMLFASDPRREAIFLVAGDKFGNSDAWYRKAVPLADERVCPPPGGATSKEEAERR